ncbi:hypothetical protein B484DRAFT_1327 [Ochromonadaceae sp. CCMP2298]|nr:hypothetical protein B484DRAFT_1327 [Ochromonadaceae sp. CCMP2298]
MGAGSMGSTISRHPEDDDHKDNNELEHEGWSSIKDKKRRCCTDTLFLLAIIAMWTALTLLGLIVCGVIDDDRLDAGDPRRLINSIDYEGSICGYHKGVYDKPNAYYMLDGSVVCVEACPSTADYSAFVCRYDVQAAADASVEDAYQYVNALQCMYVIKTVEFVNRCLPDMSVSTAFSEASDAAAAEGVTLSGASVYSTSSDDSWFTEFLVRVRVRVRVRG